jgi:aminopeptidase
MSVENKINENKNELLIQKGALHIKDILKLSIKRKQNEKALVIYDEDYELTTILLESYKLNFIIDENVKYINFNDLNKDKILAEIENLNANDLVVMIQSTNFRLDDFRIRLHLFSKKLKVIEHMHLNRNKEDVYDVYIESLKYDVEYYHKYGHGIKSRIDNASKLVIKSNDAMLRVDGELEPAKLNIGNYDDMVNVGGTFPIGEVFSEAKNLTDMNGEIYIYALADDDFVIRMYEPFKIKIENGEVVTYSDNTPEHFIDIYNEVVGYERPVIREIGFGLNRAITRERPLGDITAFERIYGMHLSLGEKHTVYKKENITSKKSRYHVDLFPMVDEVTYFAKSDVRQTEELLLFKDKKYVI